MNIPKFDFDFDFTISLPYLESSFSISLPPGTSSCFSNGSGVLICSTSDALLRSRTGLLVLYQINTITAMMTIVETRTPPIIPPIGNDGGAETAVLEVPPEVEALELKLAVLDFMNTPATELPDAGDEGVKVVADVGTKILRIRLMKQKFLLVFACSPGT
jgi:hypothetical protein